MKIDSRIKPRLGIQLNQKHPLARGLVAAWVMNEATGDKVFDLSGNGYHGTNNGSDWVADGLDLNGSSDYIDIGTQVNTAGWPELTAISYMKCSGIGANEHTLINNWGTSSTSSEFLIRLEPGNNSVEGFVRVEANISKGGSYNDLIWDDNGWHSVAMVFDTTDLKAYLDGVVSSTVYSTGAPFDANNSDNLIIGSRPGGADYFDGVISTVLLYNRALSAEEIAWLNREPYAMFQQPISPQLYAFFDEGITLTVAALAGVGLLDNVALTQKHTLAVQALSGAGTLDNVVLTQKHLLALQELLSSGILDAVSLTQKHILSVQELSGAGTLDNVVLTQKHILAVQELLSAGTLDNIELSISTLLVVAELLSSGALDNIDLTQKHTLIIQELASAGALDNIELTQKHLLSIQSLLSAGTLDNIELLLSTLLVVADLISAGQLDNTVLTQKHTLTVDEVLSAGQLDGVALTQKNLLAINDLISSGVIDNIQFDIATGLICITLTQATEYNISLIQGVEYNISLTQTGGGVC